MLLRNVKCGSAGITSTFIRSEWPSIDIPLDNEAFAVPEGHNAPQQVRNFHFQLVFVLFEWHGLVQSLISFQHFLVIIEKIFLQLC